MSRYNKKHEIIINYGLTLLDIACAVIAYAVAFMIRYNSFIFGNKGLDRELLFPVFVILQALNIIIIQVTKAYSHFARKKLSEELLSVLWTNILLFIFSSSFIYALKFEAGISRLVLGFFVVLNAALCFIIHCLYILYLRHFYRNSNSSEKFLILTTSEFLPDVHKHMVEDQGWSYDICAIALMDYSVETDADTEELGSYQVEIIDGKNAEKYVEDNAVDAVFMKCPMSMHRRLEKLIQKFLMMGLTCHYCTDNLSVDAPLSGIGNFASYPVMTYAMTDIDYRYRLIKRLMDICGGLVGILITAVFTPFVALAIKLDSPGPVFFSQQRVGKNGRRFKIYKFRSMYIDAEERKAALMEKNEMQGLMFKMENDPRITRVGAFIRKTSIDELPQFYNVLIGEMSLVGTRPPTVDEYEKYNAYYRRRLSVTPGLTGMWQVSGRSDITNFNDVVRLDLQYIDNWSLRQDILILFKTISVVLFGKGSK